MCGRFTQHLSWAEIRRLADLVGQPRNLAPRYNLAPTDAIEVLRAGPGGLELTPMRWGLIPSWWSKPLSELPSTFNARAETLREKPMFRAAFKSRRCIVPASGFYEWTGGKGQKIPHYFSAVGGEPLALAGLWELWRDPKGAEILSATIVVGAANRWMSPFHDRMPILLSWSDAKTWIAGEKAAGLLAPAPEDALQEWTVSTRVNRSGAYDDDPTLIAAIAQE
jgi:putative SOS response-associated peptidase YedK